MIFFSFKVNAHSRALRIKVYDATIPIVFRCDGFTSKTVFGSSLFLAPPHTPSNLAQNAKETKMIDRLDCSENQSSKKNANRYTGFAGP